MQNFRPDSVGKICLTLLSLTLLTQTVFGYEEDKVSYLDSVSSAYMYNSQESNSNLLNMNSTDARGVEATLKLDSIPTIANSNLKINLSLRDSDLKQALRMIADKGGLNIVFDKSVEGKITLDLNNVTVNEAFMTIFKSSQLTYTIDGNTITVMTLEASKNIAYTRQNMTVIPIKYVNSENVASFLNANLFSSNIFGLSNKPIVTSNPRTNQIMVFGTLADVNAIKRILPMIDTKPMINSFRVNHTTPEEMAKLICDAMFSGEGSSSSSTSSSSSSSSGDKIALGGGEIACRDGADQSSQSGKSADLTAFKSTPLTVAYFPDLGKINTYGGSVEQIEVIKDFIKEHDKKQLMAYVELSVVELNETGSKAFSNTWNLWTPFISLGFNPGSGLKTTHPFLVWDGGDIAGVAQKTNNKALVYELNYLVNNGNGRVLTNPKIMVTNGKTATIDLTSDYVKTVTSQVLQNSNGITGATQKTYDIGSDEGLLIEITPFISPDGYVSMNITPEFATIKGRETTPGQTGEPEIAATLLQRRDLELKNIRIRDGETLVLAGLIKENETQTVSKMPFISDLPFIGAFFRGNNSEKAREELVIMVTPHIIKDAEDTISNGQVYDL
ncbi:MAG: secretin and TonB N-terminal domain-containing protein [Candidatus Gastranaerophilales bacterium]|nr:secretin and TonB N-terminal domain-containing protein [Candidatus Gastranaerophilales bacterium]